jgi:hypothetical protein
MTKIERDQQTVRLMISLYCKHKLHLKQMPPEYEQLAAYATKRLAHCIWGEYKPACKDCSSHCYAPAQRAMIREVMRWSGPRSIIYAPRSAWRHLILRLFHS